MGEARTWGGRNKKIPSCGSQRNQGFNVKTNKDIVMLQWNARELLHAFFAYLSHVPFEPNAETKKALSDSRSKKNLGKAKSMDEFWEQMGMNCYDSGKS